MKHVGNLEITKDNQKDFKDLVEVTGYVYVYDSAKLDAPKLETVGGYVNVYDSAKLDAPSLKTQNDSSAAQSIKSNAKSVCELALSASFEAKGLIRADGILSWLIGKKKINEITALEIKIVGKLKTSFVVQKGNIFSHGETVEKAIEDLRFKISDRDVASFNHWKKNKAVPIDEAIQGYRVITGACELGVKEFVKQAGKLPKKITPKRIVTLAKGKFGNEILSEFLGIN